jgi:hypothetical protein
VKNLWFCAIVVALVSAGCEQTQTVEQCAADDGATAAVSDPLGEDGGAACVPSDIVETELPGQGAGSVVAICSDCDIGGCSDLGEACAAYGTACAFHGVAGVCVACCNGTSGELHCAPIL